MTARPRLVRSIPFWVLFVGSLALTGVGAWLVVDRLARIEDAITTPAASSNIEVFVGQPAATVGGAVLAAGLIGLLLTLTVATVSSLLPRPAADVIETIDWTSDEDSAPEAPFAPAAVPAAAPAADAPTAPPAAHADPVIAEDPDVETPSTATPPANARD
jgi:hypothetical protein